MTDFFRADLHCHSTFSDGSYTPHELIEEAKNRGLQGLSITDHDTIAAYPEAFDIAKKAGIQLISGVEFSAMHKGTIVHILCYSFPVENELISDFCKRHTQRRKERNQEILKLLSDHEMPLDESSITSTTHTVGRPHIAKALLDAGHVDSYEKAFKKYIGDGKPCYVKGHFFSVEETIDIIHKAKGLAVIAHPHLMRNRDVMNDLLSLPFDGIEGHYARFSPDECEKWIAIGEKKGWLVTGGSDFHGDIKPESYLGSSWVQEETFQKLLEARS